MLQADCSDDEDAFERKDIQKQSNIAIQEESPSLAKLDGLVS